MGAWKMFSTQVRPPPEGRAFYYLYMPLFSLAKEGETSICPSACLTITDFAVQAEMVASETSIDVGNILWMFQVYSQPAMIFPNNTEK